MVEGHSVHRVAVGHAKRLCGRRFKATSPNGRFADGAKLINGREFSRIEAIGKNLFAFFAAAGTPDVVMHVHFGMSGKWSVVDQARAPEPTGTTRLRLEGDGIISHLSAMTVDHGGMDLFEEKRSKLGQDPLRADADPDLLWSQIQKSSKSIGALLMDQNCFAGVGNIFRCEILLCAAVHPEVPGNKLTREQFDRIWAESVRLMGRAFTLGSIITVEPHEAAAAGNPKLRRWIYNSNRCGRCHGPVRSWQINARTCYACAACQPLAPTSGVAPPADAAAPILFNSHCASEPLADRLATPQKLRVAELRESLGAANLPTDGKKAELVARLQAHIDAKQGGSDVPGASARASTVPSAAGGGVMRSARAAAADKSAINESRSVEHVAEYEELDDGAPEWVEVAKTPGAGSSRKRQVVVETPGPGAAKIARRGLKSQ
jgi:formamidopyrimidine-DNA glycosylase